MNNNKIAIRIKSAAFIRRQFWNQNQPYTPIDKNVISNLPVSQSIYVSKEKQKNVTTIPKLHSIQKISLSRINSLSGSEIWRKIYSTRSQARLKSLNRSKVQQQPIRINLIEKVDRIRSKHTEREQKYKNNCYRTEKLIMERCSSLKKQGEKGDLNQKFHQLLAPFQYQSKQAQERYRAKLLLKIKKH